MTAPAYHPPCASPAQHDAQIRAQIADEQALASAKTEVLRLLRTDNSDVQDDLIPALDGDGVRNLHMIILLALKADCPYARALLDGLAQAEMDREALA